jgi:hypothetical protein
MAAIHFRNLVIAGLIASLAAGGGTSDADAQSGAQQAARDGKKSMSDARAKLKELRGGRSGGGTHAGAGASLPDWYPKDIWLPEDFTLASAQKIGSRTFLVRGTTEIPTTELVDDFREELSSAGYKMSPPERTPSPLQVLFNLNGLESGQVIVSEVNGKTEIRMNFSKDAP